MANINNRQYQELTTLHLFYHLWQFLQTDITVWENQSLLVPEGVNVYARSIIVRGKLIVAGKVIAGE